MGEAKRRKQKLGMLYGTSECSNRIYAPLRGDEKRRLTQLGLNVRGREKEGDPFWEWISIQIYGITGPLLGRRHDETARVVASAMGSEDAFEQILWVKLARFECESLQDALTSLQCEISHCNANPSLYPIHGF